jgi:hypothetical protein
LTQRDNADLTLKESTNLEILKTSIGKRGVLWSLITVALFQLSLFLVRDSGLIDAIPLGRHDSLYGAIASGVIGTAIITVSYQVLSFLVVLFSLSANRYPKRDGGPAVANCEGLI